MKIPSIFFQRYEPNCGKMPYLAMLNILQRFPDADDFQYSLGTFLPRSSIT